jgi:RNA polymerase-binding protein DksA
MAERAKAKSPASAAGRTGSEAAGRTGRTAPAKKAPAKKAPAKKAAESSGSTAETGGEGQSMAEATNTRTSARGGAKTGAKSGTKTTAKSAAKSATKSAPKAAGKKDGQKSAAKSASRSSTAKTATKATTAERPKKGRSAAETERIRAALQERRDELREEYDLHLAEIAELQRDRLTDSAGDDQADTGSKTFEREQEISLANSILERIKQVERALERLDEGSYGWCERCGDAIPVERLAAFPSATLCVRCKQLEERR